MNHSQDWALVDTNITFDLNSIVTQKVIDGYGTITYDHDDMGRVIEVSDPIKGTIEYTYDLSSNVLTDNYGTYTYNDLGMKISASYTGGGSDSWEYSKDGYLLEKNDFEFERDYLGNITTYMYPNEGDSVSVDYTYSALGLAGVITGTGNLGSYEFDYNAQYRLYTAADTDKVNPPPCNYPIAPSDFTGYIDNGYVYLSWTDNSTDEVGFSIKKTVISTGGTTYDTINVLAHEGTGTAYYQDSYTEDTTCIYQICSYDCMESEWTYPPLILSEEEEEGFIGYLNDSNNYFSYKWITKMYFASILQRSEGNDDNDSLSKFK